MSHETGARLLPGALIGVVSPYAPHSRGFGGIARATGDYLEALRRAGVRCRFLGSSASLGGRCTAAEVEALYPGVTARLFDAGLSQRWGLGLGLFARLGGLLRCDAVILQGARSFPTMLVGALCRLTGRPYALVAHATLDRSRVARTRTKRPLLFALTQALVTFAVRGAHAVVISGPLEARTLLPEVADMPLVTIENFFDFAAPAVQPRPLAAPRTYLFVGRTEPDKGILGFARVWRQVAGADSRLVLVGSGAPPYRDQVLAAVAGDPRVTYLGEVAKEQVAALMHDCAISVLPTGLDAPVTENFGNVVVEAFIAGRPAMVAEGLHWDDYAGRPALIHFPPTAEGASAAIAAFERVDADAYRAMSADAAALAARFHVARGRAAGDGAGSGPRGWRGEVRPAARSVQSPVFSQCAVRSMPAERLYGPLPTSAKVGSIGTT